MTLQVVVKPFLSEKKLVSELFQSTTKETLVDNSWQHCRPTTSNIVGYYMLKVIYTPCCMLLQMGFVAQQLPTLLGQVTHDNNKSDVQKQT